MRSRFEDFAECFPTYVEEDRNGASATFNSIADYIEAQNFVCSVYLYFTVYQTQSCSQRDLEKLFNEYNVRENIDNLHQIVLEAKDRNASGDSRKDSWKEDLDPRVAVSARTIPRLEAEAQQLRERLVAVRHSITQQRTIIHATFKLEEENRQLQATIDENNQATATANERAQGLLDTLDEVSNYNATDRFDLTNEHRPVTHGRGWTPIKWKDGLSKLRNH